MMAEAVFRSPACCCLWSPLLLDGASTALLGGASAPPPPPLLPTATALAAAMNEALVRAGSTIDALFSFVHSDKLKLADLFERIVRHCFGHLDRYAPLRVQWLPAHPSRPAAYTCTADCLRRWWRLPWRRTATALAHSSAKSFPCA